MSVRQRLSRPLVPCICLALAGVLAAGQPAAPAVAAPANELDAFMEKVLARRTVNLKTLDQYVLDETESFEILGPGRMPLHRTKRDFTWYVRDGMHVRSPVAFNGVSVPEDARQRYEASWIRREGERRERKARQAKERNKDKNSDAHTPKAGSTGEDRGEITIGPDGLQITPGAVPTEPRFVSEAYFMEFTFEPGNYFLAGREQLEGHEVLKIEYYPTRMFQDEDERRDGRTTADGQAPDRQRRRQRQGGDKGDEIERRMNKTALITLWVDPKEHQIVRYTFENVWLDFLPAAWLVRVDDIRASMTMGKPLPGVWLPREIDIHAGVTLATGSFDASATRRFSDYRLAEVATKVRVPKRSLLERRQRPAPGSVAAPGRAAVEPSSALTDLDPEAAPGRGPFVQETPAPAAETVGEIRIHGNAFLSDQQVIELAGVAVGQPLGADGTDGIARRLKASNRFDSVDVRKRYRSLTATSDVALVLVVHEKPGVRSAVEDAAIAGVGDVIARPAGRLRSKLMFLPILSFADGYGFTYGGRMSTVDVLGLDERLSVPLTWGGTRRAALEFERLFEHGPLTRIDSSVAIRNRENPRFDIRDQRVEVRGHAERVFKDLVRVGVEGSRSTISFGDLTDRLWTIGTAATLDTRLDPAYPGNAVLVTAGWTGLHFRESPDRINRLGADARGYLRVFRQVVLAGRVSYAGADATLPPYERLLLGGSASVRGFRTGAFDGDRTLVASAELRAPITSVLSGARLGVTAFYDGGKVWDVGRPAGAATWHRGAGGGVFLIAPVVRINLDVARGLETGGTRVHLSSGFTF